MSENLLNFLDPSGDHEIHGMSVRLGYLSL